MASIITLLRCTTQYSTASHMVHVIQITIYQITSKGHPFEFPDKSYWPSSIWIGHLRNIGELPVLYSSWTSGSCHSLQRSRKSRYRRMKIDHPSKLRVIHRDILQTSQLDFFQNFEQGMEALLLLTEIPLKATGTLSPTQSRVSISPMSLRCPLLKS